MQSRLSSGDRRATLPLAIASSMSSSSVSGSSGEISACQVVRFWKHGCHQWIRSCSVDPNRKTNIFFSRTRRKRDPLQTVLRSHPMSTSAANRTSGNLQRQKPATKHIFTVGVVCASGICEELAAASSSVRSLCMVSQDFVNVAFWAVDPAQVHFSHAVDVGGIQ